MSDVYVLFALAFAIFASPYIAKILRIPIAPTEIMLGLIAGSFGLLPHNEIFDAISKIGFIYLMFLAGCEVEFKNFLNLKRDFLKRTFAFLTLLYFLSFCAVLIFGLNKILIVAVPLMSVGILSTLYKDYGRNEKWLNTAMNVGVIGEIVSIAILSVAGIYVKNGFGAELLIKIFALVSFLLSATFLFKGVEILFWWYPSLKSIIMPKYDKNEKDIRFAIAILCAVCGICVVLGLEIAVGAFIAGIFIPTFFSHKTDLPQKLSSFGFGFLVPIFFIHTGATVEISALLHPEVAKFTAVLVVVMFVFRQICSFVFLKNLKFTETLLFALSLSMPLTLLIATATMFYEAHFIEASIYYSFIAASLVETLLAMVSIKFMHKNL